MKLKNFSCAVMYIVIVDIRISSTSADNYTRILSPYSSGSETGHFITVYFQSFYCRCLYSIISRTEYMVLIYFYIFPFNGHYISMARVIWFRSGIVSFSSFVPSPPYGRMPYVHCFGRNIGYIYIMDG